jgi:membrane fusion protein, multidrug efflux system
MLKRSHLKGWLLLAALVLAVGWGVWRALDKRAQQQVQASQAVAVAQQAPVYELTAADVTTVRRDMLLQTVAVSGGLRAVRSAVVKAKAAGELQGLSKREGDPVRLGEVLARVDSTDAQSRVRQAEQQAQAAAAQVRIARRAQDNNQALVGQGFISATALDNTAANLAAAEANLRAAEAALDMARKALADTVLLAPLSGWVSARLMQDGERVAVDGRVLELVDLSAFELEAALSPADAAWVQVGQRVTLQVEGLMSGRLSARVVRINPNVQPGSRSVLVYLQVPAQVGMRQGLFAQGRIEVGQTQALAVPATALRNDKPQPYLQVVQDGKVKHWPVGVLRQGLSGDTPMLALEGLDEGTPVLTALVGPLREGVVVRLPAPAASR